MLIWPVRLSVRTLGFHPGKRSSILLRVSILKHIRQHPTYWDCKMALPLVCFNIVMPRWWNGIHGGLRSHCRKDWEFESLPGHQQYGDEASMVMQWTVNPPPSGTTGSIPVISTKLGNVAESGLLQQSWKLPARKGPWVRISPFPPIMLAKV